MTSLTQREAIFMDKPDFLSVIPGLLCSKLLLRLHLQQEVRKIVISEHETLQVSSPWTDCDSVQIFILLRLIVTETVRCDFRSGCCKQRPDI